MRNLIASLVLLLSLIAAPAMAQPAAVAMANAHKAATQGAAVVQRSAQPADSAKANAEQLAKEYKEKQAFVKQMSSQHRYLTTEKTFKLDPSIKVLGEAKRGTAPVAQPSLQRAPRKAQARTHTGQYISRDSSYYDGVHGYAMQFFKGNDGKFKLTNLYGLGTDTINIDVDTIKGTVSIQPQVVYKSSSMTLYIYPFDFLHQTFYNNKPVNGTIDENGEIRLEEWGLFAPNEAGTSASVLNAFASSRLVPSGNNASYFDVTSTRASSQKTVEYPVLIESVNDKQLRLVNFANTGYSVLARITSDHRVIIAPQVAGYNSTYGDLYLYPATNDKASTADTKANLIGSVADGKLSFGPWLVISRSETGRARGVNSHVIQLAQDITWPQATTATFEGNGTAASPYLLKTATDVEALAEKVELGDAYTGSYFQVANDIDLSSVTSHLPIGTLTTMFAGQVDGGGHTISGLAYNNNGANNAGLFGVTDSVSVIKNLNLKSFNLTGSGSYVGTLAGQSHGTIENVTVTNTTINSTGAYVGGLTGYAYGPVRKASFQGNIAGYGAQGGIAGYSVNEISDSHVTATITLRSYFGANTNDVGGIAAYMTNAPYSTPALRNCWFSGQIIDQTGAANVGGLTSTMSYGTIERCFNTGTIITSHSTSSRYDYPTGGLAANVLASVITDSYNAGTIIKSGESDYVGGLFGSIGFSMSSSEGPIDLSTISNCYNSGFIVSNPTAYSDHRGIWGTEGVISGYHPSEHFFTNCYTDVQLTAMKDTVFGMNNADLLSGQLPSGFSSDVWTAKAGQYPTLKQFAGVAASKLSAVGFAFASGDNSGKVKNAVTFTADDGITTQLYNSSTSRLVDETTLFKVSGTTITPKTTFGTGLVEAYVTGDASQARVVSLAAVPKAFDGDGTAASPYLIKSKADLETLNKAVYYGQQPFEDDYFLMANDIDAGGFGGIGVGEGARGTLATFQGDFNGGGHTISGLKVTSMAVDVATDGTKTVKTDTAYNYGGLFRIVGRYGHVHNFTLDASNTFYIYQHGGTVAGYLEGKLDSVANLANVQGYGEVVGGLVGRVSELGSISHSYNGGDVITAGIRVGGIAGYNSGSIIYSQNDGDITSNKYELNSTGSHGYAGGIAGYSEGSLLANANGGAVASTRSVGGIAGRTSVTAVNGNLNTGLVTLSGTAATVGAIVGETSTTTSFEGNAYDASINTAGAVQGASREGVQALSTATLVSGKKVAALDGASASSYAYAEGQYPVLKQFATQPRAQLLRQVYINFADGEQMNDIRGDEPLAQATGITWKLSKGVDYTVSGATLTVHPTITDDLAKDTLTATLSNAKKVYYLSAIPKVLPGDGTAAAPFEIKSKDDLNTVAAFIKKTGTSFPNYYFKVLNDIDYAGDAMQMIADGNNSFQGDFNGDGHTISGYTLTSTASNAGMFGTIGSNGVVRNLTLNGTSNVSRYSGTFVGQLYGTLRNVANKGTITPSQSSAYTGGIVGDAREGAVVDSAFNYAEFNLTKPAYVAGVVGRLYTTATVKNSGNYGNIKSTGSTAGLVAYVYSGGNIERSFNAGEITSTGSSVGGLIGSTASKSSYSLDSCWNTGEINANNYVGGLIGNASSSTSGTISRSWNSAAVTGKSYTGGIGGSLNGASLDSVYNTGAITSTTSRAAGLIATYDGKGCTVTNCWNTGEIIGCKQTGGLFGSISGNSDDTEPAINNCWNLGTVIGTGGDLGYGGITGSSGGTLTGCWNAGNVATNGFGNGGITGYGSGLLHDCANLGEVSSTFDSDSEWRATAGGLQGYGDGQFINSYNMGAVTGKNQVAGIDGGVFWAMTMQNVFNAGVITPMTQATTVSSTSNFSDGRDVSDFAISNLFYDKTATAGSTTDDSIKAVGLTPAELFNETRLGDHYNYARAAYPTLKAITQPAVTNFYAASVLLDQDDDTAHVRHTFYVGVLDSVKWTSSSNIAIADDGTCQVTALGDGWVTKTTTFNGKTWQRTYKLTLEKTTGIDSVEKDGLSEEGLDPSKPMFNVLGQRVGRNYQGIVVQKGKKYIKR